MDGPVADDTITDGNPVAVAVVANRLPAQATQTPRAVRIQISTSQCGLLFGGCILHLGLLDALTNSTKFNAPNLANP